MTKADVILEYMEESKRSLSKLLVVLAITLSFIFGVYCGAKITFKAIEDVSADYPTKGEGYKSSQKTAEKYSEQTRRLKN